METYKRTKLKIQARDALLVNDEVKRAFFGHAALVNRLYKAILPDQAARQYRPKAAILNYLALMIKTKDPTVDISKALADVEAVLDESITPKDYIIQEAQDRLDLRQIDFEALAERFKKGQQRTELERLRGAIGQQLGQMIQLNRQRMDFQAQFEKLIDDYNSGTRAVVQTYYKLVELVKALNAEEQRHLAEGLSEEELALFDLLVHKPEVKLTKKERQAVKKAARELLTKLQSGLLTLDWRRQQRTQAQVRITIEDVLDNLLPEAFTDEMFEAKCDMVYQHVYENYHGEGQSTYSRLPLGA